MVKIISSKYFMRMFCKWHILDTECGLCGLGCPLGDLWLSYKEWLWKKKIIDSPLHIPYGYAVWTVGQLFQKGDSEECQGRSGNNELKGLPSVTNIRNYIFSAYSWFPLTESFVWPNCNVFPWLQFQCFTPPPIPVQISIWIFSSWRGVLACQR